MTDNEQIIALLERLSEQGDALATLASVQSFFLTAIAFAASLAIGLYTWRLVRIAITAREFS